MGQGLGKNSPVQLSLGRENYEALIERHGQWIRWRVASKCACVNPSTFQPDIHCRRCGGRGVIYSFQPRQTIQTTVMAGSTDGILEIDSSYEKDSLVKVYDSTGNIFSAEKNGVYVVLGDAETAKGSYYNIILERDNLQELAETAMHYDNGYYSLDGMESTKASIDGVYYSAPGDIISIERIVDANGEEFEPEEFRLNKVLLKAKTAEVTEESSEETVIEPVEPLLAQGVRYVPPYVFALLSQNLSRGDLAAMTEAQGDAVCTFPYSCDVAENDVLTVLAGTITQKDVQARTGGATDPLPAFFVSEIVGITAHDGREFTEGEDFVLYGTNSIKWLTDCLGAGDGYSVTYRIYPTYTVVRNIPQLRSSENQRFPKKAVVKYMNSYSDRRRVNRQL